MLVSQLERKTALGTFASQKQRKYYNAMVSLFTPMHKPQPGQWLYSFDQSHQSFANYRLPYYNPVTPQKNIIYIQPFGEFDKSFLQQLCIFCECFYANLTVKSLPSLNFEDNLNHITTREQQILQFQKEKGKVVKRDPYYGKQYLAQDILEFMQKIVPKDAYCVMGITLKDIYAGKNWNYVYGWAKYVARVGIFSFLRWDEAFAEGKTETIDWNMILYPSLRTMIHEIGHMFGITHCVYYMCLMNGYMDIDQNYKKPFEFCPICLRKLANNIGFDKKQRYNKLLKYCQERKIGYIDKDAEFYMKLIGLSN